MTHRFFVSASQLGDDVVTFTSDQAHQIERVLRLRPGARVHVFDGVRLTDRVVELTAPGSGRVVGLEAQADEPRTRLVMCPALLQREKFESVLQKLTELGAAAIGPVITARSLVREPPDERREERWRAILREAAEQSGRGVVPALLPTRGFDAAMGSADGAVIVAYEREPRGSLAAALAGRPSVVSVFVGPEGGFTAEEAARADRRGAQLVTLGPRVLRTETASPVLAALVLYALGDLQRLCPD